MYELNAAGYIYNSKNYIEEFRRLLCGIVACYLKMIGDNIKLPNDENEIRNKLLKDYLHNDDIRFLYGLTEFLFDREVPDDNTKGRTDIKIQTKNTFITTAAYYTIECKRLDNKNLSGTSGLNAKYIEDGIYRFVSKYYSTYCRANGMIGFIVDKMNVHENLNNINTLAKKQFKDKAKMIHEIHRESFIPDFEYHYSSVHNDCDGSVFTLYHLMFDVSDNLLVPSPPRIRQMNRAPLFRLSLA
jgi:hypothetical protein